MKHLTDCKNIETAINRAKKRLIAKAEKDGLYENFGQLEYRIIHEHFVDWTAPYYKRSKIIQALEQFSNWAENYTPYRS